MTFDPALINDLIHSRRSVFPDQFTDQVIPDAIVEQILENAHRAPTHKKTEPWRFFVFAGTAREQLAQAQAEIYKTHTPAEKFSEKTYQKLLQKPLKASHIIAIAMQRDPRERVPEIEEIEAVACAVQNIYLSATAYGLGGYWGSGGITYYAAAKEYFGLGEKDRLLGFFYLGYPASLPEASPRSPISEKVTWV
ncbi:MAG: nitroreductase [Bernardetiaceae bacterium]